MTLRSPIPFDWGRSGGMADAMARFQRDMSRIFGDAFPEAPSGDGGALAPRMDVRETDKQIVVSAELPGVDEKDVEVTLVDDLLTIKGEKKSERKEEKKDAGWVLTERSYGAFQRSLRLPFAVPADGVKAMFEKGVLTVTVPKPAATVAATRKIPIGKA